MIINLSDGVKTELLEGSAPIQLVLWAPSNNALVYVFQNNIYYRSSVNAADTFQVTSSTGTVSNGVPDWVYEGNQFCFELFGTFGAIIFIHTHQTSELTPKYVFRTPSDHLRE